MTKRDTLNESLRQLEYEIAMLVAVPPMVAMHQLIPARNTARPDGYYWANDRAVAYLAGMESGLTHARLLDDFFKPATGQLPTGLKTTDRYAAEYCADNGWHGIALMTDEQHDTIDKQLSQFTTMRAARRTCPPDLFSGKAVRALAELALRADQKWQPRLHDILGKAQTEQGHANSAWNAG
jgi:hypothetical protein